MFSRVKGVGLFGIDSYMIEIEADVSNGLPAFDIVGLPDATVKESRDRIRAAIKNCGFKFPVGRITVTFFVPRYILFAIHFHCFYLN